jgi:cell division protein FtsQ
LSVSPRVVFIVSGLAVLGVVTLALATDHRGERIVGAAVDTIYQGAADAGLRLQAVRLAGASAQATPDILRAAALTKGAPLLGVDLEAVRQRVEHVGWVKSARVERLFPDSVIIAIDERKLLAVWEHDNHVGVIDAAGTVAPEADPGRFASLPLVVGVGANLAAAAILPVVAAHPRLAERLDALVRVDDRRWDLRLKGGTIVQLPAANEEAAMIRLDQLDQQSRLLDLNFERIDLRDPEMVAVRPRENPAAGSKPGGVG